MGIELAKAYVGVRADTSRLRADFKKAEAPVRAGASRLASVAREAMSAAGAIGVGMAFVQAMRTIGSFEQSMINVRAHMRLLGKQGEKSFKELQKAAREMGATTQYTAAQAADTLDQLGLAGMRSKEAIATLPAVLNLAAAGNLDLAEAAKMVAVTMAKFGLGVDQASRVSDVLISAETRTLTTTRNVAEGLANVGNAAAACGIPLEDVVALLATMAKKGVPGAEAGVALRMAFVHLLNPVGEGKEALEKYQDVMSRFTKGGQITDVIGLFRALAESLEDPTDAMKIFGRHYDRIIGLLSMMKEGHFVEDTAKGLREDLGISAEIAAAKMSTFFGALKSLVSAVQELAISALTPLMKELQAVLQPIIALTRGFAKFNEATGGVVGVLIQMAVTAVAATLILPKLAAGASLVGKAIRTDIKALRGFVKWVYASIASMVQFIFSGKIMATTARFVGRSIKKALIGTGIGILVVAIGAAVWGLMKLWKHLKKSEAVQQALNRAAKQFAAMWEMVKQMFLSAVQAIWPMLQKVLSYFGINVDKMPETVEGAVVGMIGAFTNFVVNVFSWIAALIKNWRVAGTLIKDHMKLAFLQIANAGWKLWNILSTLVVAGAKGWWASFKAFFDNIIEGFKVVGKAVAALFKGVWEGIKSWIAGKGFIAPMMDKFRKEMAGVEAKFKNNIAIGAKVFTEEMAKGLGKKSPLEDDIKEVKKSLGESWAKVAKTQSEIASKIKAAAKEKAKKEEGEKKKAEGKAGAKAGRKGAPGKPAVPLLEAGTYGIPDLGKAIQDALLKPAEDKQDKMIGLQGQMVNLAEESNKLQEQMLDLAKKQEGVAGGTEEAEAGVVPTALTAPTPAEIEAASKQVTAATDQNESKMIALQQSMVQLLGGANQYLKSINEGVRRVGGPAPAILT